MLKEILLYIAYQSSVGLSTIFLIKVSFSPLIWNILHYSWILHRESTLGNPGRLAFNPGRMKRSLRDTLELPRFRSMNHFFVQKQIHTRAYTLSLQIFSQFQASRKRKEFYEWCAALSDDDQNMMMKRARSVRDEGTMEAGLRDLGYWDFIKVSMFLVSECSRIGKRKH